MELILVLIVIALVSVAVVSSVIIINRKTTSNELKGLSKDVQKGIGKIDALTEEMIRRRLEKFSNELDIGKPK